MSAPCVTEAVSSEASVANTPESVTVVIVVPTGKTALTDEKASEPLAPAYDSVITTVSVIEM